MSTKKATKVAKKKPVDTGSFADNNDSKKLSTGTQRFNSDSAEKSDSKQSCGDDPHSPPPLPKPGYPDPRDVVQLATQLVAAQVVAHSHHETALNLFSEFRQLALDVTTTLRHRPADFPDLDTVVRAAVDSMDEQRLARLRSRKTPALQPMSHPDLDRLFQSAMRRAHVMLNAPADPERIVFAEQIFEPSESFYEGAIRKRFIAFGWTGLKSGESVADLMKNMNQWFSGHLTDLSVVSSPAEETPILATDGDIPIDTRIDQVAGQLQWLLDKAMKANTFDSEATAAHQELSRAVSLYTSARNGLDIGGTFQRLNEIDRSNLIYVMFGGRGPNDGKRTGKTKSSQKSKDNSESEGRMMYRPWAIFRYLRKYGSGSGDELGASLNCRLRATRSKLNPNELPNAFGIESAEFAFGPLHEEAEYLLDADDLMGMSDTAENSDELSVHGTDPSDISGFGSELDRSSDGGDIVPF